MPSLLDPPEDPQQQALLVPGDEPNLAALGDLYTRVTRPPQQPIWPTDNPVGTSSMDTLTARSWRDDLGDSLKRLATDPKEIAKALVGMHPAANIALSIPDVIEGGKDIVSHLSRGDIQGTRPGSLQLGLGALGMLPFIGGGIRDVSPELKAATKALREGLANAPGVEERISTAVPWSKKIDTAQADPHTTANLNIGVDRVRASEDALPKNAQFLKDRMPDLPIGRMSNPDSILDASIEHMADNIVFLHNEMRDKFGQDMIERASKWYDGANRIATEAADAHGYHPRQTAGMYAALSPQKDWFQNVSLGDRILDVTSNQKTTPLTVEMGQWLDKYIAQQAAKADTPKKQAALDELRMSAAAIRGRPYREINDPATKALWVRAYDEAHNDRSYLTVTPEGERAETQLTDRGNPQKVAWGSFNEIGKAIDALAGQGDVPSISRLMGGNHKVRSFYNNIVSPNAPFGDTTIDTHAIAAAHLRPLAASDPEVAFGLGTGGSSDSLTGSKGGYGIYHAAYQRATDKINEERLAQGLPLLLPRQTQSIGWEGVRGLFPAEDKRNTDFFNKNFDLWADFKRGRTTADETRRAVRDHAGGVRAPSWWQPPTGAPTQ